MSTRHSSLIVMRSGVAQRTTTVTVTSGAKVQLIASIPLDGFVCTTRISAGDERHRLFCMRAVPACCCDLHREKIRDKEYGGRVA